jgi:hypothetical protein
VSGDTLDRGLDVPVDRLAIGGRKAFEALRCTVAIRSGHRYVDQGNIRHDDPSKKGS